MKKIWFLLLLPFLFTNCDREEPAIFRMDYEEDFQIAAGLNAFFPWLFEVNNIDTNIDDYLMAHNVDESTIVEINPRSANLTTVFASAEYDFIRNISVRLYEDDVEDYQEIFYRDNVPLNTGGTLDLIPTLVNVKQKLTDNQFNVVIMMEFRESPPQFIETFMRLEFSVK